MNTGSGVFDLGFHKFCSVSGLGGERPHGYVYRVTSTPDENGKYHFNAFYNGYGLTMDLHVTCID